MKDIDKHLKENDCKKKKKLRRMKCLKIITVQK